MKESNVRVTNSLEQDARNLTLIFVTLKLCGVITWNWLWVISPVFFLVLWGFIYGIGKAISKKD